jgi:hypothetical protein
VSLPLKTTGEVDVPNSGGLKLVLASRPVPTGGPFKGLVPDGNKAQTIRRYLSPDERIRHDASPDKLETFLNRSGGAIWRIFWLHLQHPGHFPIYDQHVHRAMAFMLMWTDIEIPGRDRKKVQSYLENYRSFFDGFSECDRRQVDRALWTFGRFLKSDYGRIIECRQES